MRENFQIIFNCKFKRSKHILVLKSADIRQRKVLFFNGTSAKTLNSIFPLSFGAIFPKTQNIFASESLLTKAIFPISKPQHSWGKSSSKTTSDRAYLMDELRYLYSIFNFTLCSKLSLNSFLYKNSWGRKIC